MINKQFERDDQTRIKKKVVTRGRCGLRNDQEEIIEDLLPKRSGTVGATAKDNRIASRSIALSLSWEDFLERFVKFRVYCSSCFCPALLFV